MDIILVRGLRYFLDDIFDMKDSIYNLSTMKIFKSRSKDENI